MKTDASIAGSRAARAAQDVAKRRRVQYAEFKKFCSGGTIVFTGLLLAALYGLLTHQIPY
jgi:hypothetical protein